MAIIVDEENKVVAVENQPDAPRAMFKNLPEASTTEGGVGDVLINGTSIVDENGDADIPIASASEAGAVKIGNGIQIYNDAIRTDPALDNDIKAGAEQFKPIAPLKQHRAAFYGLARAAGDTTQSLSANVVGNYTDEAKAAIQKMLGVDEWKIIKTVTLDTDVNTVIITTDNANNSFKLRKFIALLNLEPSPETTANTSVYVKTDEYNDVLTYSGGVRTTKTSFSVMAEIITTTETPSGPSITLIGGPPNTTGINWNGNEITGDLRPYTDYIEIYTTGTAKFGTGSVITIIGVVA